MVPGLTSRDSWIESNIWYPRLAAAIGIGRPDKGLRAAIVLGEEPIDRDLEVDERRRRVDACVFRVARWNDASVSKPSKR
jgi:hypothetical protein